MAILALDHFTIRTRRLEDTIRFFKTVIQLDDGWRPAFKFPGVWLYASGKPVLHLVAISQDNSALSAYLGDKGESTGAGCVDHLSFRGGDLAATQAHFLGKNQHFRERVVPEAGEHQLFLEDPNGVTIELIFPFSANNRIVGEAMPNLDMQEG